MWQSPPKTYSIEYAKYWKDKHFGADFGASFSQHHTNWIWSVSTTVSINRSIDVTNSSSPSYGDQIPYTPFVSGSFGASAGWKGYLLSTNLLFTGERYSLNENIPINYLDQFFDWNLGLEKEFTLARDVELAVNMRVMNLLNKTMK